MTNSKTKAQQDYEAWKRAADERMQGLAFAEKMAQLRKTRDDAIEAMEATVVEAYGLDELGIGVACGMTGQPEGARPAPSLLMNFPSEHFGGDTWAWIMREPRLMDLVAYLDEHPTIRAKLVEHLR